jgi:hypothetical protein
MSLVYRALLCSALLFSTLLHTAVLYLNCASLSGSYGGFRGWDGAFSYFYEPLRLKRSCESD